MRVSTTQFSNMMMTVMQRQSSNLARTFDDISSGKRIQQPSDDALATVKIQHFNKEIASLEQYVSNVNQLQGTLQQEDTLLANMVNVVQRTRESVLLAGNGAYDESNLKSVAGEIDEQINELVSLANYRLADGQYMFAGNSTQNEPIQESGRYYYQGDDKQRMVAISTSTKVASNDPGFDIFFDKGARIDAGATNVSEAQGYSITDNSRFTEVASIELNFDGTNWTAIPTDWQGNTLPAEPVTVTGSQLDINGIATVDLDGIPTAGDSFTIQNMDIFTALTRLSDALNGNGDLQQEINTALAVVDQTISSLGEAQTNVGGRLNMLDSTLNSHQDVILMDQVLKAELEDLDYSEAISRLNLQETALQASQQAYMKIQGLSLFNYLR
ncbi:flagellar hook-associated protein FlgL [Parendozoicomonas haliclonae]|uniref:Flagellar hook-associated protein 3 n=1 Tax=Parendozoicomonas haliclonae TaxID=1960125 RepID=A0A1X7AGW7_9GAMM|nr:flagellar hook-associated protein FlgL [Parendozoicomonas haliclonae]SMA39721.1 Flagellar hook-associated protein 3 [Parendozoicomonas haliclonae]